MEKKTNKYMVTANQELNDILKEENYLVQQKISRQKKGINSYPSSNSIDFIKQKTSINLQLGKYSFVHFDIFNHISNFFSGEIKVGIILPNYNSAQFFSETINSILKQKLLLCLLVWKKLLVMVEVQKMDLRKL